jgi:hypothetical protein
MRTIVHLSDLHFGALQANILAPLKTAILAANPDLIAVSGDLTQRARRSQFVEARAFLDALPFPILAVPGNHDVPLYNFYARFTSGLQRYRKYICADTEPFFQDQEIAVLGINTARSLAFKGGRINPDQVALARARLAPLSGVVKIIVTHHPFDLPAQYPARALVGRARMAMTHFIDCGIDLFLAGQSTHLLGYVGWDRWLIGATILLDAPRGLALSPSAGSLPPLTTFPLAFLGRKIFCSICRSIGFCRIGTCTRNVEPRCGSLSTSTVPPSAVASSRANAKPRPKPS